MQSICGSTAASADTATFRAAALGLVNGLFLVGFLRQKYVQNAMIINATGVFLMY